MSGDSLRPCAASEQEVHVWPGKFYGNMLDHAGQQSSDSEKAILSWVVMPFPVLQHHTDMSY